MGQKTNYAVGKVARIKWSKEECVSGMEQRSNDAEAKVVQIGPR